MNNKIARNPIFLSTAYFIIMGLQWTAVPFSFLEELPGFVSCIASFVTCIGWIAFYYILKYYDKNFATGECMRITKGLVYVCILFYATYFYIMICSVFIKESGFSLMYNDINNFVKDKSIEKDIFWIYYLILTIIKEFIYFIRCLICVLNYVSFVQIFRNRIDKSILKNYIVSFVICLLMIFWQILIYTYVATDSSRYELEHKICIVAYYVLHVFFIILINYLTKKINEKKINVGNTLGVECYEK